MLINKANVKEFDEKFALHVDGKIDPELLQLSGKR
jgi:hypothetical protein